MCIRDSYGRVLTSIRYRVVSSTGHFIDRIICLCWSFLRRRRSSRRFRIVFCVERIVRLSDRFYWASYNVWTQEILTIINVWLNFPVWTQRYISVQNSVTRNNNNFCNSIDSTISQKTTHCCLSRIRTISHSQLATQRHHACGSFGSFACCRLVPPSAARRGALFTAFYTCFMRFDN